MHPSEIEKIEINLFLEAIYQRYGYDFRQYAKASIRRRVRSLIDNVRFTKISDLIPYLLYSEEYFRSIVFNFSITVTEMFRDPPFYKSLREKVVQYLKTYPFIKIWHAGCATGEEVYSLAILLKEEGLYDRATIFATDYNELALKKAKDGIYPLKDIQTVTSNYQLAGGNDSFSNYYFADYDSVIMDQSLKKRITFANHNLVTDSVFGEMQLIICRNVLIYFERELQDRVLTLFKNSLVHNGFLCLGSRETLDFTAVSKSFQSLDDEQRIFRKKVIV